MLFRSEPVVKFIGPIKLESGTTNKHSIKLPSYIGSVRTMLIAKNNEAYGIDEKTTAVRKPLMLLASLPKVLGPGENIRMQVDLFIMSDKIKKVDLKIITNELVTCTDRPVKTILINSIGEKTSFFNLLVNKKTGIANIEVIATSDRKSTRLNSSHIPLSRMPSSA